MSKLSYSTSLSLVEYRQQPLFGLLLLCDFIHTFVQQRNPPAMLRGVHEGECQPVTGQPS